MKPKYVVILISAITLTFCGPGNESSKEVAGTDDIAEITISDDSKQMVTGELDKNILSFLLKDKNEIDECHDLGMGYDDFLGKLKSRAFNFKESNLYKMDSSIRCSWIAEDGEKSSDYSKIVSASASGGGSGFGGSGSVSGSYKSDVKESSYDHIFIAKAIVEKPVYHSKEYKTEKNFSQSLKDSDPNFVRTYGTSYVSAVHTGWKCVIVFRITETNAQRKSTIKANASASAGSFSGSASFKQTINSIKGSSDCKWEIYVNGGYVTPPSSIDSVVDFLFNFPKLIQEKNMASTVLYYDYDKYLNKDEITSKYDVEKALNPKKIEEFRNAFPKCDNMLQEAIAWQKDIEVVLNKTSKFNPAMVNLARQDRDLARNKIIEINGKIKSLYEFEKVNTEEFKSLSFTRNYYPLRSKPAIPSKTISFIE